MFGYQELKHFYRRIDCYLTRCITMTFRHRRPTKNTLSNRKMTESIRSDLVVVSSQIFILSDRIRPWEIHLGLLINYPLMMITFLPRHISNSEFSSVDTHVRQTERKNGHKMNLIHVYTLQVKIFLAFTWPFFSTHV
jgi:hypothetical protein